MTTITILGSGNVATALAKALHAAGNRIECVYSRDIAHAATLAAGVNAKACDELSALPLTADLYIIAVSDAAIETLANAMPAVNGLVVHTSGTTPAEALAKHIHYGVLYPLQSFSRQVNIDMATVPVLVEASDATSLDELKSLVHSLGARMVEADSMQRRIVHLAAVFANNFSNHLFYIASQILAEHNLPFDIIRPLIAETADKVMQHMPAEMQTGPAKRNDMITIQKHLDLLKDHPEYRQLYEMLSGSVRAAESRVQ